MLIEHAGAMGVSSVLELVDAWTREIAASAERDERKWGASYREHFANGGSSQPVSCGQLQLSTVRS